jgi:hypothetical protein
MCSRNRWRLALVVSLFASADALAHADACHDACDRDIAKYGSMYWVKMQCYPKCGAPPPSETKATPAKSSPAGGTHAAPTSHGGGAAPAPGTIVVTIDEADKEKRADEIRQMEASTKQFDSCRSQCDGNLVKYGSQYWLEQQCYPKCNGFKRYQIVYKKSEPKKAVATPGHPIVDEKAGTVTYSSPFEMWKNQIMSKWVSGYQRGYNRVIGTKCLKPTAEFQRLYDAARMGVAGLDRCERLTGDMTADGARYQCTQAIFGPLMTNYQRFSDLEDSIVKEGGSFGCKVVTAAKEGAEQLWKDITEALKKGVGMIMGWISERIKPLVKSQLRGYLAGLNASGGLSEEQIQQTVAGWIQKAIKFAVDRIITLPVKTGWGAQACALPMVAPIVAEICASAGIVGLACVPGCPGTFVAAFNWFEEKAIGWISGQLSGLLSGKLKAMGDNAVNWLITKIDAW